MKQARWPTGLLATTYFDGNARKVTIALAIYAVAAPLAVAQILASSFKPEGPAYFGPATFLTALAMTLLGPAIAVMTLALRGHTQVAKDLITRGDSEPQQAIIRLAIMGAALAYLAALAAFDIAGAAIVPLLAVNVAGILSAWLLFAHLMAEPQPSIARRVAAMLNDVVLISAFLHVGGSHTAPWFSMYLWVTFGYGLRFGIAPLIACAVFSLVGFGAVYATTPYWQAQGAFAAGVWLALILLPSYAASLVRGLRAAKTQAEAAAAAKGRFIAIMSHELRTPLGSIISLGALLARGKLDEEQRGLVSSLQHSARALLGLINDLLDLSRLEAKKVTPAVETFVLHEVMGGAVALVRPQAQARGQALTLRIDPALPHVYRGFPQQLRQVLVNLLANAVKFTPAGHIGITGTLVSRRDNLVEMRLAVRDEGVGIPKEAQAQIFDVYTQADGSVAQRYGGTGLGLAIAKQLVELMNGTISLESEVGKGSTFAITLTLERAEGDALHAPDLLGHKLVVISADNEVAARMEGRLQDWHGEVQRIADSETALGDLALAGRSQHAVILIIDGRDNPLAALSLAHRSVGAMATTPLILFIAPAHGGEAIARLAASQLAAVIEAPVADADLASALLGVLAGESLSSVREEETPAVPLAGATAAAAKGLRVLVADDNAGNRKMLKNVLENAGHQVELANDGEAALSALDRGHFDLALLDITMPDVNGYEVAKLYRVAHVGEWRVPLVALASDATTETERLCREAGMDAVLTKPVDAAQLLSEVEAVYARAAFPQQMAVGGTRVVTPITAHPRFAPDTAAVVDEEIFNALRKLGGNDFVIEVVETFRKDARHIIARLKSAVEAGDLREFRELIHSLRSGAVNVGGTRLCQNLNTLRDISSRDLSVNGAAHIEKLEAEFARLEIALEQQLEQHRAN
jgi:two-component system, sensor histidine kinase RpfC